MSTRPGRSLTGIPSESSREVTRPPRAAPTGRSAATVLILAWAVAGSCGGPPPGPVTELTPEQWEEDLDFVVGLLAEEHPDLFGYHQVDPAAFERDVARLREVIRAGSTEEILFGLDRLVASVGDGHTSLDAVQRQGDLDRLPLQAGYFGDEVWIYAVAAGQEAALAARITAVEGVPVGEVMAALSRLISHDNPQEFRYFGPTYLATPAALRYVGVAPRTDTVVLTLSRNDTVFDLPVPGWPRDRVVDAEWVAARPDSVEAPLYLQRLDEAYWFQHLPADDALYINWDRVNDADGGPSLRRFYGQLFDVVDREHVGRLIVDLRNNNGGNFHRADRFIEGIRERPWLVEGGAVYVLTAPRTFSAATNVTARLRYRANALIVGEASRGNPNFGYNAETVALPNSGLHMEYTDRLHDGIPFPELGTARLLPVDLPAHNTFQDYVAGRDRVLETALAHEDR
jgi:hypothetical protein